MRLNLDAAMVLVGDPLCDRQSESGPRGSVDVVAAVEPIEDPG
jgi:hypothetical protein